MNQIIIFSEKVSSRQTYIFDFIFNEILKCPYKISTLKDEFINAIGFKINYSTLELESDLHIVPYELLFETNIHHQEIKIESWKNYPSFFKTSSNEIPFDIFSASFYLISRYEEYLPFKPDLYQRFPHTDSVAFKNNFLQIPLVDLWIQELKKIIVAKNSQLIFGKNEFKFTPTYDIDIAYSYLGKGLKRNIGGAAKDASFVKTIERIRVLTGTKKDPFDSYDFLDGLHSKFNLSPIYFFLVGNHGPFDKNILFENEKMQTLFQRIKSNYQVGIHPSYQSHDDISILQEEIQKINSDKSRQHYIRFNLPTTFQNLIQLGIKEDYSMGYGSINGFRASTSFPFYWFDLSKNEKTQLRLFPFSYMECNSHFEQHLSKEEAFEEMKHYIDVIKKAEGTMICIWHNFTLGTDSQWLGWKEKYEAFLELL